MGKTKTAQKFNRIPNKEELNQISTAGEFDSSDEEDKAAGFDSAYCVSTQQGMYAWDKNDSDTDYERHLRRWIIERGAWMSYDAYCRACIVVGMNQMLQALAYNIL